MICTSYPQPMPGHTWTQPRGGSHWKLCDTGNCPRATSQAKRLVTEVRRLPETKLNNFLMPPGSDVRGSRTSEYPNGYVSHGLCIPMISPWFYDGLQCQRVAAPNFQRELAELPESVELRLKRLRQKWTVIWCNIVGTTENGKTWDIINGILSMGYY